VSLEDARQVIKARRVDYSHAPHGALQQRTPAEFVAQWSSPSEIANYPYQWTRNRVRTTLPAPTMPSINQT
jgi:hypothetical protein